MKRLLVVGMLALAAGCGSERGTVSSVDRCVTYVGGEVDVPAGHRLSLERHARFELPDIAVRGEVVVIDASGIRIHDGKCAARGALDESEGQP